MAMQPSRLMTYQEFEDLERLHQITELLDGEYCVVSPTLRHQRLLRRVFVALCTFLEAHPELGEVLTEPFDIVLSRPLARVIQPDIFILTAQTLTRIERGNRLLGMPDLAVEILSGDGRYDRGKKLRYYGEYRIPELWHVSQDRPRVEIYRTDAEGNFARAEDLGEPDRAISPLLPGFALEVAALYRGLFESAD